MGKMRTVLLIGVMMALLSGCSQVRSIQEKIPEMTGEKEWVPDQTAIQVHTDGTLTETIVEQLDKDYYQAQELEAMVKDSVASYTADAENGANALTLDSFTAENKKITLALTYASGADYRAYNQVPFSSGSMLQVQMDGFQFDGLFRSVSEGVLSEETLSGEEPLSHKEYQVLVTDGSCMVHVPWKVLYVSDGASLVDEYTVLPPAAAGDTGEEKSADEENGKSDAGQPYLYVVYEYS